MLIAVEDQGLGNSPQNDLKSQQGRFIGRALRRMPVWYPAFIFSIAGAILAWTHLFADYAYGEDEPGLTFWGFVVMGSICKIGFLACVPFLFRRIFLGMQRDGRRALLCAASWAVTFAILIALLNYFHDRLTGILNNSAVRFYPVADPLPALEGYYLGREVWLSRWQSGEVLALEGGYVLALIILLVGIGYGWKRPEGEQVEKIIVACLALPVTCIVWPHVFNLVIWDYDVFIGSMVSGPLALDLMFPIAMDPSSQIAFLVYLAFTLSSYAALRFALPKSEGEN